MRKLFAMHDVILRDAADGRGELAQNIGEQAEVDVHVNGFMHVFSARPFENQRDTGRIEMRLKAR